MRSGKLPPELLARLVGRVSIGDPRVQLGPRPGEDAAVIEIGGETLVISTDPITFVSARAAWYAVQVNANDVAATGADPAWLAATLLLPQDTTEGDVDELFTQMDRACQELGITLVTGHTEITPAVNRVVVIGTMLGLAGPDGAVTSGGARPGDAIVLAGSVGVEGTAILSIEANGALRDAGVPAETLAVAADLLAHPGISVVPAARSIRGVTFPHAMHDATEGGVASALREVAIASGAGLTIEFEALPLLPQTNEICRALGLDPLGLISSGCLIAVVDPADARRVVDRLHELGIAAATVGVIDAGESLLLRRRGVLEPLPVFDRDEIASYFDSLA